MDKIRKEIRLSEKEKEIVEKTMKTLNFSSFQEFFRFILNYYLQNNEENKIDYLIGLVRNLNRFTLVEIATTQSMLKDYSDMIMGSGYVVELDKSEKRARQKYSNQFEREGKIELPKY